MDYKTIELLYNTDNEISDIVTLENYDRGKNESQALELVDELNQEIEELPRKNNEADWEKMKKQYHRIAFLKERLSCLKMNKELFGNIASKLEDAHSAIDYIKSYISLCFEAKESKDEYEKGNYS